MPRQRDILIEHEPLLSAPESTRTQQRCSTCNRRLSGLVWRSKQDPAVEFCAFCAEEMAPITHQHATAEAREHERQVIEYWRQGVSPAFVFLTAEQERPAVWDGSLGFLLCVVMIDDDGHAIDRQNGEPSPPFFLFSLREWHAHGMTTRYQAFPDGRIRKLPHRHTVEGARILNDITVPAAILSGAIPFVAQI